MYTILKYARDTEMSFAEGDVMKYRESDSFFVSLKLVYIDLNNGKWMVSGFRWFQWPEWASPEGVQ